MFLIRQGTGCGYVREVDETLGEVVEKIPATGVVFLREKVQVVGGCEGTVEDLLGFLGAALPGETF